MNQNQIQVIRQKFQQVDEQLSNMNKAISWLSLASISLNELARKDHSKEEIEEALKEAAKQLAKINAAMKGITCQPQEIWERHFGIREATVGVSQHS